MHDVGTGPLPLWQVQKHKLDPALRASISTLQHSTPTVQRTHFDMGGVSNRALTLVCTMASKLVTNAGFCLAS